MARVIRNRLPDIVAVACLFGVLFLVRPPVTVAQPAPLEGLDGYVEQAMAEWNVPGLSLAVVKDDSVVYAQGYGVRERGTERPVDEHTLFAIGSTTKAFTSALLGQLVDQGEIAWSDRVTDQLPWFQLHDPWVTRELTVRDLLTHRSGLPRCDLLWHSTNYDRREILRRVRHCEPEFSFRSQIGYQNIMYLAAGRLAAEVAGSRWDQLVEDRIFGPLGMDRSNTSVDSLEGMSNVATPHAEMDGTVRTMPWRDIDNIGPAGSINSSAREMAQWLRLQLNEGSYEGQRLMADSSLTEIRQPHMVMEELPDATPPSLFPTNHFTAYGFGWVLFDHRGRKVVRHGGLIDGMQTEVGLIPEEDLGVVVLTNYSGNDLGPPLMFRIFNSYLDAPRKDWAGEYRSVYDSLEAGEQKREQELREARVADTSPSLDREAYTGTYRNELYGTMKVTGSDEGLRIEAMDSYGGTLDHWHFDTYRVTWDQVVYRDFPLETKLITFELDPRGEVSALKHPQLGTFQAVESSEDSGGV